MSVVSPLVFIAVSMLYLLANAKEIQTNVSTSNCKQYPGMPGLPGSNGVPGVPGTPGSPGRDGTKGEKGRTGKRGLQGATGFPGKLGPQGPSGPKGEIGEKGQSGTLGAKGNAGISGNIGPRGPKGFKGSIGTKGKKGDTANIDPRQLANWKQCVWRIGTATDNSKIKECSFLTNCSTIRPLESPTRETFKDMMIPNATDGILSLMEMNAVVLCRLIPSFILTGVVGSLKSSVISFEGFCENLPRGTVLVELWVGKCSGYSLGNAYTGWNSVSRIMIEEVPPPQ